ncbi:LLM class flavin-dependent oxidoreductase [Nonomuraea sp. NPDC050556]|uniref:LLM class flavin-dependent oxidoreductase n=1 Tax=Nonomuraea sp. NPDC050556 TaxID=3364369 RepID=UPI00378A3D29
MRVGVFLVAAQFPGQDPGEVLRDTVEAVVAAEEAGFDDAWVAEHHFMSYGVCPSAVTLMAAAAGRTRRIGLGTAVSVLSTQHPVALAEQASMVHHLSGGRFTLGVGRGGPWVDLEVFGTGLDRFESGFAGSLDVLCRALDGYAVGGGHEVGVVPSAPLRPVVACTSSGTVRVAAERGLPMLLGMHVDDAGKAATVREYGPGGGHVAAVVGNVADTTAEAVRELTSVMPTWMEPGVAGYIPINGQPRKSRNIAEYVEFLARIHPVGSADHCVETIRRTVAATGIGHLIVFVEGTKRTLDTIRRFGAEVLPRVRSF